MRNLSMKKFGTPIAAAPGSACEKVGLAGVGTPSPWRIGEASGLPSALAFWDASSSPVAFLRCALPTVFCPCWPPAETEGPLSARPGAASVVVPVVLAGGAAGDVLVVVAGSGAGVGEELVPVSA